MADYQNEIIDKLFENAVEFLNIAIDEIIKYNETENTSIKKICILIQTTIELATKYALAYNFGNINLKTILDDKYKQMKMNDVYKEFKDNNLIVKRYGILKNRIWRNKNYKFSVDAIENMKKFEHYRNSIIHFNYNFQESDLKNIIGDFVYILINIVIPLLYEGYSEETIEDLTPNEFLKIYVGEDRYKKISSIAEYKKIMLSIANKIKCDGDTDLAKCPYCNELGWLINYQKCILCNYYNIEKIFLNCPKCNSKKTVGYDSLNIEFNNNVISGSCIKCGTSFPIIKCKKCGNIKIYEGNADIIKIRNGIEKIECDCRNIPKKFRVPVEYVYISTAIIMSECIENKSVIILNRNKNIIRIIGRTAQKYYINLEQKNKLDESINDALNYLNVNKYIKMNISNKEYISKVNNFIEQNYFDGSDAEYTKLCTKLFNSIHGEGMSEKVHEIMKKLVHNFSYKFTKDELDILYKCREYFDVDTKIFLKIDKYKHKINKPYYI